MDCYKLKFGLIGRLLLLCIGLSGSVQGGDNTRYQPGEINLNGLTVKIDPRIELLYTAGYIGGYPLVNGLDIRYKQEVESAFAQYQDHAVVNLWKEIGPNGFMVDGPVFCVIKQMKNLNEAEQSAEVLSQGPDGENDYDKFVRLLTKFAVDTDFKSFFNRHQDFYRLILENIRYNFRDFNEVERLERYFGDKKKDYTVIISLLGAGNFGPRVQTPSGMELYCVLEPQTKIGHLPGFDNPRMFEDLVWHEFSHSFVNPLVDEYKDRIDPSAHLYEPIASSMRNQAYHDWIVTVKEHIVRAVTIRLAADKYGEELAQLSNFRVEMGKRFIYVKPLCDKLKEYEANRHKYASFKEFFPELISVFKAISEEDIDAYQAYVEKCREPNVDKIPNPMNGFDTDATLIIKPTAEKDPSAQQQLYGFIERFKSQVNSKFRIVTDTEALKLDLAEYDLILFGTPQGNLVLKKFMDVLPLAIRPNRITANRIYEGRDYQLITGWVNPLNEKRKMTIYTAQDVEKVININQVAHGGTNYVIAKNYMPVKYGNYRRFMNIWIYE